MTDKHCTQQAYIKRVFSYRNGHGPMTLIGAAVVRYTRLSGEFISKRRLTTKWTQKNKPLTCLSLNLIKTAKKARFFHQIWV